MRLFAEINAGVAISFENSRCVSAGLIHPPQQGSKASLGGGVEQSGTSHHREDPPVPRTVMKSPRMQFRGRRCTSSAPRRHSADQRWRAAQTSCGGCFWPTPLSLRLTFASAGKNICDLIISLLRMHISCVFAAISSSPAFAESPRSHLVLFGCRRVSRQISSHFLHKLLLMFNSGGRCIRSNWTALNY